MIGSNTYVRFIVAGVVDCDLSVESMVVSMVASDKATAAAVAAAAAAAAALVVEGFVTLASDRSCEIVLIEPLALSANSRCVCSSISC